MKGLVPTLKRASPMILTILGAAGVIGTAVLAVRATPEAVRRIRRKAVQVNETVVHPEDDRDLTIPETIQAAWRCYIPAVSVGLATILCIFGANGLTRRQQASIASAYALIDRTYKEYRNKVKELYGPDTDVEIGKDIAKDNLEKVDLEEPEDGKRLFYDEFSGQYFERTMVEVMDAEYHLNREFILEGSVKLNDFYELLGLPRTDLGNVVGWDGESGIAFYGYQWIDFEHQLVTMDDGLECYILHMEFAPHDI